MCIKRELFAALLAVAAIFLSTIPAFATSDASPRVEAAATIRLNVRAGPGISYKVIDSLDRGEVVQVGECTSGGWCYIYQNGPDGWVSSRFLTSTPAGGLGGMQVPAPSAPELGNPLPPVNLPLPVNPPPPQISGTPINPGVCFYTDTNYRGGMFCLGVDTLNSMPRGFDDNISSVRLFGAVRANLCPRKNLVGYCSPISRSRPNLNEWTDNTTSSGRVYTPVQVELTLTSLLTFSKHAENFDLIQHR